MMLRIIFLLSSFVASTYCFACSCYLGSADEKLRNAETVFIGEVRSVHKLDEKNSYGEPRILVDFDVDQSFKNGEPTITLDTFYNGISCEGFWFKEKREYLVYVYEIEGRLSTWYCGGVLPKDDKEGSDYFDDLKYLKKLHPQ